MKYVLYINNNKPGDDVRVRYCKVLGTCTNGSYAKTGQSGCAI